MAREIYIKNTRLLKRALKIEEILAKINELEEIVNSKERKSKKWANAGEIIKWIAEKGIDVGLTLLPLLLKLGE